MLKQTLNELLEKSLDTQLDKLLDVVMDNALDHVVLHNVDFSVVVLATTTINIDLDTFLGNVVLDNV